MQSMVPENGDVFSDQTGAILDGAILISSWQQQSPAVWRSQVSEITKDASYRSECDAKHPACMHPEDLFFDS
jgi:hypothetical protein